MQKWAQAPPEIIRVLIDAYPDSVRQKNKLGRDPLELAAKNYRTDHPYRSEVLALLRWHHPVTGNSTHPASNADAHASVNNQQSLPGFFSQDPPEQLFSTSAQCVVCMEELASVAMIPCGHVCLCMTCVQAAMKEGRCPVARCEVQGVYQVKGEQIVKMQQQSMYGAEDNCQGIQCGTKLSC